MPALLTMNSVVLCAHGGVCKPTVPAVRVRVAGSPAVAQGTPWIVSGCSLAATGGNGCATVSFQSASLRVKSNGMPLLLQTSAASGMPSGAPVNVIATQPRVNAQ